MAETRNYMPLVLRLTRDMLETIDEAAHSMKMSRTGFIRLSLARNLSYWRAVEADECVQRLQAIAAREQARDHAQERRDGAA